MGKNLANPVAAMLSAVEMLRWLGEQDAASMLERAVRKSLKEGQTTGDLGGNLSTSEVAEQICSYLEQD
jgi:isocitrate/isopropylmalate dehydrogenase